MRVDIVFLVVILTVFISQSISAEPTYSAFIEPEVTKIINYQGYANVTVKLNSNKLGSVLNELPKNEIFILDKFPTDNGFSGIVSKNALNSLMNNREVKAIYSSRILKISLSESVPLINSDTTWKIYVSNNNITGKNSTVCVIDTGVNYTHSALGGCLGSGCKVIGGYDYVNNDATPMDDNGHGTHVSGIISSNGTTKGVAPDSNLIALKACDSSGNCPDAKIISSMQWCNLNSSTYNIKAISISIFDSGKYPPNCPTWLDEEINDARNRNISVFISSGNNGYKDGISHPACSPNATSIGATYDKADMSATWITPDPDCTDNPTKVDQVGCGSNRASILDLLAPGAKISSTSIDGTYEERLGTSMAAPHVAGIAALMQQAANLTNQSLTPSQTESIMKRTGKPIYDSASGLTFPRIDAYRSVMAVLYDVFVNDLKVLHNDTQGRLVFEFSVYNDFGANVTVNYTINFGDGTNFTSSSFNMSPSVSNETLAYVEHTYQNIGTFVVNVTIKSSNGTVANQSITINAVKPNFRALNLTILNSTGLRRVFEFKIHNNATASYSNIDWQLNVSGDASLAGTGINLTANETIFVYADYTYASVGSHNITATTDYLNRHSEYNETDNSVTISDN